MRAVFFDRDGTINREVDILRDIRELKVLRGAGGAIRALNRLGFLVIVATNQPVIARGWLTEEGVEWIHDVLLRRLKRVGAKIDAIYYCPHHPEANVKKYRRRCACRKPNIGMIRKAIRRFHINVKKSFMVGDSTRDILAGKRAKLTTILVKTGYGGKDKKYKVIPDFIVKNLREAVKIVRAHGR